MTAPESTSAPSRRGRRITVLLVAPVVALFGGAWYVMYGFPEWYDKVPPPEMLRRMAAHNQEAYRVLDLGPVLKPRSGPGHPTEHRSSNSASTGECYPDGLEAMEDKPLDGIYDILHGWTIVRKDGSGVRAAFGRLKRHLAADGWEVDWGESIDKQDFDVIADKDGYRLSIRWEADLKEITGLGTSPCARFPDRSQERAYRPTDYFGTPERQLTPPDLVPNRRR
ncbi:hypothetical protein [Streptomyces sp. RTd22]|uniref:hypothetical protein n=1 Tax=Streptomyces sp. RTd22 TaxID=1841249 RepID=UPI00131D053E|nr:hypothetical protein [Streptomyces sp. RTd22]